MIFDSSSKRSKRILLGRNLFFKFNGNLHHMWQEGAYREYKKLKIPKKIEILWTEELFDSLKEQINNETNINKKIVLIGHLLNYGIKTDVVASDIIHLLNSKIDTFSKIRLCEELKRCFCDKKIAAELSIVLQAKKKSLLNESITIDEDYFCQMPDYDFSIINIKNRINAL